MLLRPPRNLISQRSRIGLAIQFTAISNETPIQIALSPNLQPRQPTMPQSAERHILVVEDQADIADLIAMHVRDLGHQVTVVHDGQSGFELASNRRFDLIVLDVMLPGRDGLDVLRGLRQERVTTPILMLTARSGEIDRVLGLELGADDYLTKPFSVLELTARVKAMLRRADLAKAAIPSEHTRRIMSGELVIDEAAHEVRLRGQIVGLTSKEFDLLFHLARHPGRAFTRAQLLDAIWGTTFEGYEHNVNTHINRLRSKIEVDPANPVYVLTVRGLGYRFTDQR
jgi:DNA-binding response OmpR family regulator